MLPSDEAFLMSSWLKSYRDRESHVRTTIYFPMQKEVIEKLLARSKVVVAVDPEDTDMIYAYAVGEPAVNTLHYVYVKHSLRMHGVAKKLVEQILDPTKLIVASHRPNAMEDVLYKYNMVYNPYVRD